MTMPSRFGITIAIFAWSLVGLAAHTNAQPAPAITSRYASVNGVKLHYLAAGKGDARDPAARLRAEQPHVAPAHEGARRRPIS